MPGCLSANSNVASRKTCPSQVLPVGRTENTEVCSMQPKSKAQGRCEFTSAGADAKMAKGQA